MAVPRAAHDRHRRPSRISIQRTQASASRRNSVLSDADVDSPRGSTSAVEYSQCRLARITDRCLAEDAPRELVIGTIVIAPPGTRGSLSPEVFQKPLPPGFAIAAMNFLVTPNGPGRSLVSTETRVFANSPSARRQFSAYWRLIYP